MTLRSGSVASGLFGRRAADPSIDRERAVAARCQSYEPGEVGKVGLHAGLPNLRVAEVGIGKGPNVLASVYAGGSTALKTISMICSGKASLDTPIRLLAH